MTALPLPAGLTGEKAATSVFDAPRISSALRPSWMKPREAESTREMPTNRNGRASVPISHYRSLILRPWTRPEFGVANPNRGRLGMRDARESTFPFPTR